MKKFKENIHQEVSSVVCNMCGKEIRKANDYFTEDYVSIDKTWGYFSGKDGVEHSFELCESCYDKLVSGFKVPVDSREKKELL